MRVNVGLLIVRGLAASVVLALLFAAGSAAAPASGDSLAPALRKDMKALVAEGVPGVVVLVRRDGRTVQLAGGYSNLEKKTPMRVGDRFRIGSVTKSFVATVVLQLVGEGKLSLDDSIEHWLPGLVPNGGNITIRQLLSHQSGLFDYLNDERVLKPYLSGNFGYVWTPQKLVAVSTSHPALFAPGAKFSYSNTNYIVLGLIVEAATKDTIKAQLQQAHLRATRASLDSARDLAAHCGRARARLPGARQEPAAGRNPRQPLIRVDGRGDRLDR